MRHSTLHRTINRLRRCLSALAVALILATVVSPPPPPLPDPSQGDEYRAAPLVNWNS